MHSSRARSLKRDGRDVSPSMKQPAVVPSCLYQSQCSKINDRTCTAKNPWTTFYVVYKYFTYNF